MHSLTLICLTAGLGLGRAPAERPAAPPDLRNIETGSVIPDEGYCDQPYVVITKDGNWLCTLTTGRGVEGQRGQHVVSTISADKGRTWSPLVDIEIADGPEASWAMPLVTPSGRVYVFYDYNGDRVSTVGNRKNTRADMLGWYVYKYSDDHGRTWSRERYRLPVRPTSMDRENDFGGTVQMLWGIGKPILVGHSVYFGFSKIGKYLIDRSEGWFFRSDNLLAEDDATRHQWIMLPDGDIGLRAPKGPIAEEQNLVALHDGSLYCVYRTVDGHPCHAYSRDRGHTWTPTAYATYTPGGRLIRHPRACPRLWKAKNGNYLLWYHNHGGRSYEGRNPAWVAGGIEKDGHMHWSQPEILLYDADPHVRMSYPDLIEQDGRYWVTETQKTVARVHEVDAALFEGLWDQAANRAVARRGLVLDRSADGLTGEVAAPKWPDLSKGGGFSIDMRLEFSDLAPLQRILDARDEAGKGVAVGTTDRGTVEIALCDGRMRCTWDCDPGLLAPGRRHHITIIVDGGPKIVTFVVDGMLCDGGTARQFGWGLFADTLGNVDGAKAMRVAPSLRGRLDTLRIYDRYLRTSEAVGNFHAGVNR